MRDINHPVVAEAIANYESACKDAFKALRSAAVDFKTLINEPDTLEYAMKALRDATAKAEIVQSKQEAVLLAQGEDDDPDPTDTAPQGVTLTVEERGNGLPAVGEHVEDHNTGEVYRILAYARPCGAMEIDPNTPGASHRIRVIAEGVDVDPETVDIHDSLIRTVEGD